MTESWSLSLSHPFPSSGGGYKPPRSFIEQHWSCSISRSGFSSVGRGARPELNWTDSRAVRWPYLAVRVE